ncbi:MAG TPA: biopolymer transporter ExbD [Arcobacter sp.]|jgi:biopolymer transport protein ExbD|nr:biopolymer transporter ExbD [Arcobacter sp.]
MKRREPLGFDLTALIDVVFILIIFFIVSSTFRVEEKVLNLTLPSSNGKALEIETKQITIELSSKKLGYNGQNITFLDLQNQLEIISDKSKAIIVRIDKSVPYNRVVKLLNLLQLNELNNLALVTKE